MYVCDRNVDANKRLKEPKLLFFLATRSSTIKAIKARSFRLIINKDSIYDLTTGTFLVNNASLVATQEMKNYYCVQQTG